MKKIMTDANNEILEGIEEDLALVSSKFRDYNINYFSKQKARYHHVLDLVGKYSSRGATLELGSFPFHLTLALKKAGYLIDAVDIDPERAAEFVEKHHLLVEKRNFEIEGLGDHRKEYDLILLLEVYEHLRIDPLNTLSQIRDALSENGIFVISVPNMYSIFNVINFLRGRGFDDPYNEFNKIKKYGHMGHVREYSSRDMLKILTNTGFEPIETVFSSYEPLSLKHKFFGVGIARHLFPQLNAIQTIVCKKAT